MEPAPVRSPESDGVVDLGAAIQGALDRHEQQEATQKTQNERRNRSDAVLFPSEVQRQQQQHQEQSQATERGNVLPPLVLPRPDRDAGIFRRIGVAPAKEATSGSETDDARSFDLESDCFGDATILSSPIVQEPPGPIVPYQTRILTVLPPNPQSSSAAGNEAPRSQGTPGLRSGPRRPKSSTRNTANQGTQQPASDHFANQDPHSPRRRKSLVVNPDSNSTRRTPLRQRSGNSDHGRDMNADESISRTSYPVSLFDRDTSASTDPSTNPFFARSFYAPELSEMDDAMQQDIQSNSGERFTDGPPPQEEERGWSWQKPIQSLPFLRRDAPPAEQGRATAGSINWWQLLNPYTYLQAVFWMARETCTSLLNFLDRLYPQSLMDGVSSIFEMLLYFAASVIGLITVISVVHAAIFGRLDGGVDGIRATPNFPWTDLSWPDITHMADRAHELIPKLSWPTWSRSGSLPDLTNLDSDGLAKLDEYLKQYQREFESLQNAGKLHESSLAKLEAVLPRIVHTPIKNGKVAVAPEFWYGMRDLIHQDNEILTFEKKGSSYEIASEAHWKAIAAQITRDPAFAKEISKNVDSLEERVKSGASGFWDSWVKSNDAKIAQVLGSALEQIQSAGSQKEFDKRLQRIVKEHMDESNKKAALVSREEFLQHVSNEFATHRAEVRAELEQIKPKLEELVRQAAELARKGVPETMSKAEIVALVQGLVKKAVANINLDAMARGKIQAHWNTIFKQQVNYFGIGAAKGHQGH
ncbi:hypothetical protein NQ176_g11084 [Zarea fungicola]|uniref:Uncharacterized protein n=1 Tax=Zarea fungicola TaxID=93591 RepID=A0ACC1MCF4_9HYPO|nr:hypothetical protein NQ176_g11084 [Lecanicillium fungicola]